MITLQRRHAIIFLQMLFLVLLVFTRNDQVSQLHQHVADSSMQLVQNFDDMLIECADMDEDTVGGDHVSNPDYSIHSNTSLLALTPESGSWPLAAQSQSLPLVYLPVFSPPKIRA